MVENAREENTVSVSSRTLNTLLVAVIAGLFSLAVAYINNRPDDSDRYYGHQGDAHEQRTAIVEEWIRQHTIFGWETSVSNERRFTQLEDGVKHATEITRECMEKVK